MLHLFPRLNLNDTYELREQTLDDVEDFYRYLTDPEVNKYIIGRVFSSLEEARLELLMTTNAFYIKKAVYWAISEKVTNKMIGGIGFLGWEPQQNYAEIFYDLSKEYWNQGITTQAMKVVLEYAQHVMKLKKVSAVTVAENIYSNQLLQKHQFIFENRTKSYCEYKKKSYMLETYNRSF